MVLVAIEYVALVWFVVALLSTSINPLVPATIVAVSGVIGGGLWFYYLALAYSARPLETQELEQDQAVSN